MECTLPYPHLHRELCSRFVPSPLVLVQEYLLVTADTTFVRRRRIARLICHEVSHMWYGDIVTPESFDELWLKEVRCLSEAKLNIACVYQNASRDRW